jgi:flagellar basal-body rod protein FlgG
MNGAYYIGATGLQAQGRGLETIANNIANINTVAFKRGEVRFEELVPPRPEREDTLPHLRSAPEIASGVRVGRPHQIFEQGEVRETGKPLDLAISGDGFVEVLGADGQTWLWRGGSLRVNEDGYLATSNGTILKALIAVPEDSTALQIESDGRVYSTSGTSAERLELGRIDLAIPDDVSLLEGLGEGFYRVADEGRVRVLTPSEGGKGVLVQGALEASNVNLTTEMVTLLLMQRAYAANAQVVQASDQLMGIANGLKR